MLIMQSHKILTDTCTCYADAQLTTNWQYFETLTLISMQPETDFYQAGQIATFFQQSLPQLAGFILLCNLIQSAGGHT